MLREFSRCPCLSIQPSASPVSPSPLIPLFIGVSSWRILPPSYTACWSIFPGTSFSLKFRMFLFCSMDDGGECWSPQCSPGQRQSHRKLSLGGRLLMFELRAVSCPVESAVTRQCSHGVVLPVSPAYKRLACLLDNSIERQAGMEVQCLASLPPSQASSSHLQPQKVLASHLRCVLLPPEFSLLFMLERSFGEGGSLKKKRRSALKIGKRGGNAATAPAPSYNTHIHRYREERDIFEISPSGSQRSTRA